MTAPNKKLAAALLAATLPVTGPALAGKSAVTGSIQLASATTSSLALTGLTPTYGSEVAFITSVDGRLASQSRLYVSLICAQGNEIVYQWSADPGFEFPLVDQAGQGLEWDGGDASCTASLIYRVEHGRKVSIEVLDRTDFAVSGGTA